MAGRAAARFVTGGPEGLESTIPQAGAVFTHRAGSGTVTPPLTGARLERPRKEPSVLQARSSVRHTVRDLERRLLRKPALPRRWLPPGVGVDEFLRALTSAGVRYAVLRWFEELPRIEPGEDIDLLIADEDLDRVAALLRPHRSLVATQKVDLYTVSGLPGTDFRGMPYLSRPLATGLLERATLLEGAYRVPSPGDHFDSMAYHAAYHKGRASGVPADAGDARATAPSDHDYPAVLARLAAQTGKDVTITLEGLDDYLERAGLRPGTDTLERFQSRNPWLRERLASQREDLGTLAGLIVFVVREAADDHAPAIAETIERFGFEVLRTVPLIGEQKDRVRAVVRGGNWGRGPFPRSGGGPATLIFAYDFGRGGELSSEGHVLNPKSTLAKSEVREQISQLVPVSERFNPMHSSDNGWQSLEYVEAVGDPELLPALQRRIDEIERHVTLPFPVERYLSFNGKRAKVAIVDHPVHGRSVAKVFRPGSQVFFERELAARQEFGDTGLVPPLLDRGENWILSPLYEDTRAHVRRRLPGSVEQQLTLTTMVRLTRFVLALRERGCFLLDLTSHNLISDAEAGLRITDFEFLQRYPGPVPPLGDDLTVLGLSEDPAVDRPIRPRRRRWDERLRSTAFHPAVAGASVQELAAGSGAVLRLKAEGRQLAWFAAIGARALARRGAATRVGRIARRIAAIARGSR